MHDNCMLHFLNVLWASRDLQKRPVLTFWCSCFCLNSCMGADTHYCTILQTFNKYTSFCYNQIFQILTDHIREPVVIFFLPQLLCLCAYFSFLTLFIHQRYDFLVTPLLQRVNWCAKFPWLLPLLIWFMKPVDIIWFWRIMKEMSH